MVDSELGGNSGAALKSYVERIARLKEERRGITSDITDVVAEAKANGFDGPALRRAVTMYEMDTQKRQERQAIDETYLITLGLL